MHFIFSYHVIAKDEISLINHGLPSFCPSDQEVGMNSESFLNSQLNFGTLHELKEYLWNEPMNELPFFRKGLTSKCFFFCCLLPCHLAPPTFLPCPTGPGHSSTVSKSGLAVMSCKILTSQVFLLGIIKIGTMIPPSQSLLTSLPDKYKMNPINVTDDQEIIISYF